MANLSTFGRLRLTGLIAGISGFLIPFLVTFPGLSFAGHIALSIFLMAAFFWMFEPIPIHATSLLVIFLGVLLLSKDGPMFSRIIELASLGGVDDHGTNDMIVAIPESVRLAQERLSGFSPARASEYMGVLANPIIILFLGGFMIAEAAVKYNFDKNLTRYMLRPFGTAPGSILIGVMIITAVLSAFMSNTATTAMMLTVILPIMSQMNKGDRFKTALALSIPISANLGGIATPIGTPPNAVVLANLQARGIQISFTEWMFLTTPLVILIIIVSWWLLKRMFPPQIQSFTISAEGTFNRSPRAIIFYAVFVLTLLLWVTESVHGISSSIVALFSVTVLALTEVLDVQDIRKLPWEVLWLVAGGLALGIYMDQTGLASHMVASIDWSNITGFAVIALFALVAVVLSNFLSNTVTATLLMPLAVSIGILQGSGTLELIELALVIGVGTSMAMVLPISTPPNAIAMSTGMVKTSDMARIGVVIAIAGLILTLAYALVYWPFLIKN